MPRKRWIDKNNATTYHLLYRSQNDPLLHDESVSDRALFAVSGPSNSSPAEQGKGLHIADLEDELDFDGMRENEGEAAEHGIFYDDTKYDYMQHLREMGQGAGEAHFVESMPVKVQGQAKGKAKMMTLEDAIREASLEENEARGVAGSSVLDDGYSTYSRSTRPKTYQDQQDIPDEIAGFQPDMDPRLREVLEALDDEAYVDEKDEEDVFGALTQGGLNAEVDVDEFETTFDDDEGWESDATEKAPVQEKEVKLSSDEQTTVPTLSPQDSSGFSQSDAAAASAEDGDWLRDFAKFKRESNKKPALKGVEALGAPSDIQAPASTLYTLGGTPLRGKRRKGAQTNPSAYSMTSSSLARTDGQQLLDARFEKFEAMYALDEGDEFDDQDGGMSITSGMSKQSRISTLSTTSFADGDVRSDLDSMMDGFLDGWSKGHPGGKRKGAKGKRGKNGNEVHGIRMLDEVRAGLGPARLPNTQKA